jgi:Thiamine monophosphate synthase
VNSGADYIGMGPFRYTTTKKNLSPVLGLQGYKGILGQMAAKGISVPVVAIGGITADDIEDVMQTGVSGIALSGTILRATDPVSETRQILQKIDNNNTY